MSWGISEKASDKEKLKAKMADYLNGLNSCCIIDYTTYVEIFDFSHKLLDEMYELGKKDVLQNKMFELGKQQNELDGCILSIENPIKLH